MEPLLLAIDECERLIQNVNQSRNRQCLETHLRQLREELSTLKQSKASSLSDTAVSSNNTSASASSTTTASKSADINNPPLEKRESKLTDKAQIRWIPIAEYAWSDENDFVEIDIGKKICEGIGEHKEKVRCDFKKDSFVFSITDFGGKNYKLTLNNLNSDIVPEKSKVVVGRNKCTIKLCKKKGEYGWSSPWMDLQAKAGLKEGVKKDPTASLQNMMQEMYNSGDDKTRAMIGKAMEEARKKQLNPGYESPKEKLGH